MEMLGALTMNSGDYHLCGYCGRKIPMKKWFDNHFICCFCGGGE